jgi:SRSO17 transposase
VPELSILGLLSIFDAVRPAFTRPSFHNFVQVALGWLLVPGRHGVGAALVAARLSGRRHHASFHRLFSQARWEPDEVGRWLFERLLGHLEADAPVALALDDTLASGKGAKVFGLGSHLDAVRSTRRHRVFAFGHVWVVLAVVVQWPLSKRSFALPVLFRLYRTKKECARSAQRYRKKTELARELLEVLAGWVDGRRCEIAADSAYCNDTVTRGLASHLVLFGRMRPDAVLTAAPEKVDGRRQVGRPRLRGERMPTPRELARAADTCWHEARATLYRAERTVRYSECVAQWYRACGARLLKVVVVPVDTGCRPLQVFFCTDPEVSAPYLLERYASRWSIEVSFRDLKQHLGFAHSSARTPRAVQRTAPFVGLLYTVVVMWYAEAGHRSAWDVWPCRPWYPRKVTASFEDMLCAVRRAVLSQGVDDLATAINDLRNPSRAPPEPLREAA